MKAETKHFVKGMIILWSGSYATIPGGWHLCNGNSGTPDLSDKFILGAGITYDPGAEGGTLNHTHTFEGTGHTHLLGSGGGLQGGTEFSDETDSESASGTTGSQFHVPPYYVLAWIMKL